MIIEKNMKKYHTKGEILFFGAYIIFFTFVAMGTSRVIELFPIPGIIEIMKFLSVCIILLKIVSEQVYEPVGVLIFFSAFCSILISSQISGDYQLLYTVCFIFGMRNVSFYDVLKVSFFIQIMVFGITAISVYCGAVSNEMVGQMVWTSTMISEDAVNRYNLGFIHPNTISAMVFFVTLTYMCLRRKCSLIELIIGLGINYMIYQKTGSRTSFLITLLFLPVMFWFLHKRRFQRYWKKIFTLSPVIIIISALMAQIFYNPANSVLSKINTMLSGRLELGHSGFWNYGVRLFGQKILWITGSNEMRMPYNYVDCSYLRILLQNGVVIFGLICIACVLTMYRLAEAENRELCVSFLALLVYSMIEPNLMGMGVQVFFMLIGQQGNLEKNRKMQ